MQMEDAKIPYIYIVHVYQKSNPIFFIYHCIILRYVSINSNQLFVFTCRKFQCGASCDKIKTRAFSIRVSEMQLR